MELTGRKYGGRDWRTLLSSRRGTVLIAIACAVAAGAVVLVAMSRYRKSVAASGTPQTVLVATQVIHKGTSGSVIASEYLFEAQAVRSGQVGAGAIADASVLHGKVAASDIYPGQQLTAANFTTRGGLPSQLPPRQRAITLTLDSAHGMVGTIETGDHVDVYAGLQLQIAGGQTQPVLRLLMANVPVLKAPVQTSAALGAASSNSTSNVTLQVDTTQAGALAYAADNGKVWLVLRPVNAAATAPPSQISVQSLLFGTKPLVVGGKR
jgi:Flp pilus assembly protein CpaB